MLHYLAFVLLLLLFFVFIPRPMSSYPSSFSFATALNSTFEETNENKSNALLSSHEPTLESMKNCSDRVSSKLSKLIRDIEGIHDGSSRFHSGGEKRSNHSGGCSSSLSDASSFPLSNAEPTPGSIIMESARFPLHPSSLHDSVSVDPPPSYLTGFTTSYYPPTNMHASQMKRGVERESVTTVDSTTMNEKKVMALKSTREGEERRIAVGSTGANPSSSPSFTPPWGSNSHRCVEDLSSVLLSSSPPISTIHRGETREEGVAKEELGSIGLCSFQRMAKPRPPPPLAFPPLPEVTAVGVDKENVPPLRGAENTLPLRTPRVQYAIQEVEKQIEHLVPSTMPAGVSIGVATTGMEKENKGEVEREDHAAQGVGAGKHEPAQMYSIVPSSGERDVDTERQKPRLHVPSAWTKPEKSPSQPILTARRPLLTGRGSETLGGPSVLHPLHLFRSHQHSTCHEEGERTGEGGMEEPDSSSCSTATSSTSANRCEDGGLPTWRKKNANKGERIFVLGSSGGRGGVNGSSTNPFPSLLSAEESDKEIQRKKRGGRRDNGGGGNKKGLEVEPRGSFLERIRSYCIQYIPWYVRVVLAILVIAGVHFCLTLVAYLVFIAH